MQPPEGFELVPGDLANPSALNGEGGEGGEGGSEEVLGEQPAGETSEGKMAGEQSNKGQEEAGTSGRDMVFICVKVR